MLALNTHGRLNLVRNFFFKKNIIGHSGGGSNGPGSTIPHHSIHINIIEIKIHKIIGDGTHAIKVLSMKGMSRPHPTHLFIVAHPTVDKDWGTHLGYPSKMHTDEIMVG